MVGNGKPCPSPDPALQGRVHAGLQIEDPTAALTGEVIVPGGIAVIAAKSPAVPLADQPFLGEELQVPVDGPKTDPGQSPTHLVIHPLRGGVRVRSPDHLQDEPTLVCHPPALPPKVCLELGVRRNDHA